ncbi:hypothetical protein [Variovorax sp. YR216]|uniref:hypothetical protein n=1 Tax=Variovorax sp. YR216 TaxID=1882828 RepID=UPI000B80454F|nr:hypothetical protein [Variovorax sp. YR216]
MSSVSFGAVTAVAILMKPLMEEWSTGAGAIAGVHSATLVASGISGVWFGRLLDRYRFFPMALAAALATGLGLCVIAWASHLWIAYLGRIDVMLPAALPIAALQMEPAAAFRKG